IPTPGLKATNVLCFENPMPGDTVELNLYIENRNTTGERLKSVEILFPQGINVLSSTNAQVLGASRFLISSGNTGMGINLAFNDPNIGQTGEINQYEVALA